MRQLAERALRSQRIARNVCSSRCSERRRMPKATITKQSMSQMWRKHAPRRADQPNDRRVVLGLYTLSDMHLYRATPEAIRLKRMGQQELF